jgi:uncharacterized protein YcaQ
MRLSQLQARRITLAAQGFGRSRPVAPISARHVNRVIDRLGLFQSDSVNVLQRAHYLPLFSRLGAYDTELLHRAAGRSPRRLFEYWAHEAALVDVRLWPALQWRMDDASGMWGGIQRLADEKPEVVALVLDEVRSRGPLTARDIEQDVVNTREQWGWNWSEAKRALEFLFYTGQVTAARRNSAFERLYDLPERVLPPSVLDRPRLDAAEAHMELVRHAARALGVGTAQCLRDYFRLAPEPTNDALRRRVASGE